MQEACDLVCLNGQVDHTNEAGRSAVTKELDSRMLGAKMLDARRLVAVARRMVARRRWLWGCLLRVCVCVREVWSGWNTRTKLGGMKHVALFEGVFETGDAIPVYVLRGACFQRRFPGPVLQERRPNLHRLLALSIRQLCCS